jgi:small-conductance mechanosensitive channel
MILLLTCQLLIAQDTSSQLISKAITFNKQGSPVILLGDTLFLIHSSNGSFTAKERADAISARLLDIVREENYYPDSLMAFSFEDEYYITYRDRTIAVIRQNDTIGTGLAVEEISANLIEVLQSHLGEKSVKFNFMATVKNIGYTLFVVLVLIFIIWILNKIFRKIYLYADTHKARLFKSIKINTYEFLTAEREYQVALTLLKFLKIGLIIFLFLIALPLIFSIFPTTEGITRKLIGMIWSPVRNILMAVVNYLPKLITIIIIYFIFKYLIRFVRFLSMEVERGALVIPGFYPDWSKSTYNIIRLLLYAFMFVIIFPYLPGSESPIFRGVSVFLGVLFSLGSSSVVSNIMAGLVITYMRPYKRGDRIKIDDVVGDVVEKSLMTTRIRTIKNEDVTIPNSKVLTGYTVNYTSYTVDDGLIIHTTVTIGYDAPWRTVHALLIKAANNTAGVSKDPQPFVLQTSLDDFYISYQVNAYVKNAHGLIKIKSDMHQNIQDEFNRAGVEIMSPHYRAERDGNAVTIPEGSE